MSLRIPLTIEVDERGALALRELLGRLEDRDVDPAVTPPETVAVELPSSWRLIDEQHGVTYTWGGDHDVYDPFRTYEAETSRGPVRLAIGRCERVRTFGLERVYYIVMAMGPAGGMRAISEFLATDDYDDTGDVIAIIKGREGTARQFDDPRELPPAYGSWSTVTYKDRVDYPGAYTKQAVVCNEDDHEVMLNHSLAQIQLRNLDG
jgi:hypothetical protein